MRELAEAIANETAILFAGAGLSAGLGAPPWRGLIEHIAEELDYDPRILFATEASYLTLAEFYRLKKADIGPLRSWMDKAWHVSDTDVLNSKPHESIVQLGFKTIYTTNYDHNIERAHELRGRNVSKIVTIKDFALAENSRTHIVKLHGDFISDSSIVLTERDYFDRLSFDSPLDVRLRADALASTVLFIGYSLSDINIRLLLHKLWAAWNSAGAEKHRPRSYIFLARPDPVQETVLASWGIDPIVTDTDDPGDALAQFLGKLEEEVRSVRAGAGKVL